MKVSNIPSKWSVEQEHFSMCSDKKKVVSVIIFILPIPLEMKYDINNSYT